MKKKTVEVAFDPVMVKADTFGEFGKWWYAYYKTKVQATTYESYGYVAAYRCAIIIQIMCYAVKVAKPSHYIQNFKRKISTNSKKFSLPVRTFSREISTGKK